MPELSYPTAGRYNIRSWILAPKYTKIAEKNLSYLVIRLGLLNSDAVWLVSWSCERLCRLTLLSATLKLQCPISVCKSDNTKLLICFKTPMSQSVKISLVIEAVS